MIDWMIENKVWEWLFSGVGVVFIVWFLNRFIISKKGKHARLVVEKSASENSVMVEGNVGGDVVSGDQGDRININAGGDAVIAKDQGKAINIKNSQVGVVGDNTKVEGDINFKKE